MSHFYNCEAKPYLTEANTPAQARKIGAYPSVTTVMGIIKDPFLDVIWSPRKYIDLARLHPSATPMEIDRLKYGSRTSPVTGDQIPSSEFGTSVHERLERHTNSIRDGLEPVMDTPWDAWTEPFLKYVEEESIEPYASEMVVYNDDVRVAGSVDFIGRLPDGKLMMADYKCRDCKGKGGKFYEKKDCTQLAIESWMLSEMLCLDYLPSVMSICIDTETKKHYNKVWSDERVQMGIDRFKLCAKIYWMDFM